MFGFRGLNQHICAMMQFMAPSAATSGFVLQMQRVKFIQTDGFYETEQKELQKLLEVEIFLARGT